MVEVNGAFRKPAAQRMNPCGVFETWLKFARVASPQKGRSWRVGPGLKLRGLQEDLSCMLAWKPYWKHHRGILERAMETSASFEAQSGTVAICRSRMNTFSVASIVSESIG